MRADELRDFLDARNATTDQLRRRLVPGKTPETGRKLVNRLLCRERRRKRVRVRGVVLLNGTGRPELVYGQKCREEELEHEVLATELELILGRFERRVRVGKAVADGMLVKGGRRFAIEVDNHTMTAKQMREKWKHYAEAGWANGDAERYLLVVCRTKARLKRLIRGCGPVRGVALFSLLKWLRYRRVKYPWIDWRGNRARV